MSFEINLHLKDIAILHQIKEFFGVGTVTFRADRFICVYCVTKIDELTNVIIKHFVKYPLLTLKYSDFILWSKVVKLMSTSQHLTPAGFNTILTYYASINRGISLTVSTAFPEIVGVDKLIPILPDKLNPH